MDRRARAVTVGKGNIEKMAWNGKSVAKSCFSKQCTVLEVKARKKEDM